MTPYSKNADKKNLNIYTIHKIFSIFGMNPIVYGLRSTIEKLQLDYDIILIHSYIYEMNSRIALYRKLGIIKIPVVLYFHGGLDTRASSFLDQKIRLSKMLYDQTLGRFCFEYSDKIISVSKNDMGVIREKYNNVSNISYLPVGLETKKFYKSYHEGLRVIFVGRLVQWKGIQFFEDIIKSLPHEVEFSIVGDGPLRNKIRYLTSRYKNVKWHGTMPHDQVIKLLSLSDIFILPSFTEASPLSCIEASASGLPSIAFSVGDISSILPDDCGFKISPYDINDFCSKINYLIDNEAKRKEMGNNARKFVTENLDYDIVSSQLEMLLSDIIFEYSSQVRV